MGNTKGELRVGTSGFTYDHWRDVFYPANVPKKAWLEHYAAHFDTVEINSTYYHLPRRKVCESWRRRTPEGFCFVLKMNRQATHRQKLLEVAEPLEVFLIAAEGLGEKLGAVLVQLPPRFAANPARLDNFLQLCRKQQARPLRWALEFRDASWLCDEVYAVLREHSAALVVHDLIPHHPHEVTCEWVYLRFHGPTRRYSGCYPSQSLRAAAKRIREHLSAGRDVLAYFNNDVAGHAVNNAADLRRYVLE